MNIDPTGLGYEEVYRLMTGIVVPRPIAWVTSLSTGGVLNLAPFSAFTFASHEPPMLALSFSTKAGIQKDTARNILANGEYVIHIADMPLLEALHASSAEHPPEISEVDLLNLETAASSRIAVPRLLAPPVAMECRFRQCLEFGASCDQLMVGEVVMFHLRDDLVQNGKIETEALNPIARIGGPRYAELGKLVTMKPVAQTKHI